jgi:hypothetical protein
VCVLHPSYFLARYYGTLPGFSPAFFPDYHLPVWGYCPLSLGFCLAHSKHLADKNVDFDSKCSYSCTKSNHQWHM